jgi:acyl-CoA synthetase (AMP-forming)/AMP-acid ligase II
MLNKLGLPLSMFALRQQWDTQLAIVHKKSRLSFKEFGQVTDEISEHFRTLRPDWTGCSVLVALEPSISTVAAITAIFRLNAVYFPVAIDALTLESDESRWFLTDRPVQLPQGWTVSSTIKGIDVWRFDGIDRSGWYKTRDIVYSIRTSGTTRNGAGGVCVHVPKSSFISNLESIWLMGLIQVATGDRVERCVCIAVAIHV